MPRVIFSYWQLGRTVNQPSISRCTTILQHYIIRPHNSYTRQIMTTIDPDKHTKLNGLQTYNWQANHSISVDENYMDLVMLITRSSQLKQGSMACILVKGGNDTSNDTQQQLTTVDYLDNILCVATNMALFTPNCSDVHAEISALGTAAKSGQATLGCTIYITMPPCKTCFGALVVAGIAKIVSRYPLRSHLQAVCDEKGIQYNAYTNSDEQKSRVDAIVKQYNDSSASKRIKPDAD